MNTVRELLRRVRKQMIEDVKTFKWANPMVRSYSFLLTACLSVSALLMGLNIARANAPVVVVMLGDSLTAGYGLDEGQALPAKLEECLRGRGYNIEIRNAGISGDTTAGGRERIEWSVGDDVDAVFVALGGNDTLRGIPPAETKKNLDAIITQLKKLDVQILLAGMLALPNYGPEYAAEFNAIYPTVAQRHDVSLYPFLLDGVAGNPAFNQDDGIHPNEAGVAVIVENMAAFLVSMLFEDAPDVSQSYSD